MTIQYIHQFSFACSSASGVSNGMLYTRQLLRDLGFQSEIYSIHIPEDMSQQVLPLEQLANVEIYHPENTLLFVHHCMGYINSDYLFEIKIPKIMVYHNITPPEFLPKASEIGEHAKLGRTQLKQWSNRFIGAIGDSQYNSKELLEYQYSNVVTIPMLLDFERFKQAPIDQKLVQQLGFSDGTYTILFVGRICENKNQLQLIETLNHLRHMTNLPVRLVLVGEVTSGQYQSSLEQYIATWNLAEHVQFTGKISSELLAAYYQCSDVFVCLSDHEGFGMPLIEAMHYKLPVIARNSSNIGDTLGESGLLLAENTHTRDCAAAILTLFKEPALKRQILEKQHLNLQRFTKKIIVERLAQYLKNLGYQVPNSSVQLNQTNQTNQSRWQIEGPFDSSYSLAIVNRELARALQLQIDENKNTLEVSLRSKEGHGDFDPSADFLAENPDCSAMFSHYQHSSISPNVALRFCYPPQVGDLVGNNKLIHSYGWEETGFPQKFVDQFNRRLDAISVLSSFVGKTLRDSGVRIPIVVTGAGVDHLLHVKPQAISHELQSAWKKFRFLHISSCFPRKGVDVLLRSYGQAFRDTDDVTLVIKTFANPHNFIQDELSVLQKNDPHFPHVVVIKEDWNQEQLVGLYQACHALVSPSRGEGFGLPIAEAMLFELPVITTSWGGQTDFCNSQTAWCCDYIFTKADTHLGLTHSTWAEPNQHHLTELLQAVHKLTETECQVKTDKAKKIVLSEYTWDKTAKKMQAVVQALKNQQVLRNEPKIAWISSWNSRCGIANYSKYLTTMFPQDRIYIYANHVEERTAFDQSNVLRCWNDRQEENFEAILDNIVEKKIQAVVIQYNFGFCSLQNLASFLLELKQKNIASYLFLHSTADVIVNHQIRMTLSSIVQDLLQVSKIFVHGIDDLNRLKNWSIIDNVVYFPHGVEQLNKHTNTQANASIVSRWQSQFKEKKVIASYGFLLPHKGIPELIQAFSIMRERNKQLHLLLVNAIYPSGISTNVENDCLRLIKELDLQEHISFVTEYLSENDTHALLSCADLIVFPYQYTQESSSAAVRVGLAVGKKVAVTPLEIFDDVAEAVHYFSGVTSHQLAEDMHKLLDTHFDNQNGQKETERENWFAERNWKTLSNRLLNIIDGSATHWIPMLGTCRLLLAILVALSHADVRIFGLNPGVIAVVCFYLISGYVMTGLLRNHYVGLQKIPTFYIDRALRLFPQYLIIASLSLCLFFICGKFTAFLQHPPVLQDYLNNIIVVPLNYFMFNSSGAFTLIPPAWSLGAEIQFYLLMPFLLWCRIRWIAIIIALLTFACAATTMINSDTFGYRLLPGVLVFFLIGSYMYDVHENVKKLWKLSLAVMLLSLMSLGILLALGKITAPYNLETIIGLLVGVPALAYLAPKAQHRIDNFLGDLSYGVFLNHFLLQWFVIGVPKTFSEFVIYIFLSVGLSFITQRWIERPILKLRKKLRQ